MEITAEDEDGGRSVWSGELIVENADPTIDAVDIPSQVTAGERVTLSASASDPGDDTLLYTWEVSDGATLTGAEVTHTYADAGSYEVRLIVTDEDGGEVSGRAMVEAASGTSCAHSSRGGAAGWGLLLLAGLTRRRRRR